MRVRGQALNKQAMFRRGALEGEVRHQMECASFGSSAAQFWILMICTI